MTGFLSGSAVRPFLYFSKAVMIIYSLMPAVKFLNRMQVKLAIFMRQISLFMEVK